MTLGALAKPTGALELPALWRPFQIVLALFVLGLAVLLYLPFAAAGTGVVGFLPRYLEEQGLSSGEGVFWLALLGKAGLLRPTTSAVFAGSVGAAMVGLALWTRRRGANDISSQLRGTTLLLVALLADHTNVPLVLLAALPMAPLIGVGSPLRARDRRLPSLRVPHRRAVLLRPVGAAHRVRSRGGGSRFNNDG